eukprot:jgi/Bigna1/136884/aug1.36_g11592
MVGGIAAEEDDASTAGGGGPVVTPPDLGGGAASFLIGRLVNGEAPNPRNFERVEEAGGANAARGLATGISKTQGDIRKNEERESTIRL